jgi:DNA-binding transcriptional MerR regulator
MTSDPAMAFFGTVPQINNVIKAIQEAGITISNIKELTKQMSLMKPMKFRPVEEFYDAPDTNPAQIKEDRAERQKIQKPAPAPVTKTKAPTAPKQPPKVQPQEIVKKKKLKVPKEFDDEGF